MSTLHKFKAYFGMVPFEEYEDDYYDEPTSRRPSMRDGYADHEPVDYAEPAYKSAAYARRPEFDEDAYEPRRPARVESIAPRPTRASAPVSRATTRGALAVDAGIERRAEERRAPLFDESGPLSKITTLRPRDYSEARTIGERFRDGSPVIMDLVEMSNADAKRLVDFAAGLAFALRGSFDKVATKVFLLSPADIDVSAEERRRIAETGFYNQQ
ncbi:cell division protein SepF [Aldersonia kunmingensis]|uniref:cell division protein SepF n=1 Tax=Aldersonia kunmingensis TaxID=408066 RepID=UPI000836BA00|nr:cell division protein SepF [Aldersonia kunmingensis]